MGAFSAAYFACWALVTGISHARVRYGRTMIDRIRTSTILGATITAIKADGVALGLNDAAATGFLQRMRRNTVGFFQGLFSGVLDHMLVQLVTTLTP